MSAVIERVELGDRRSVYQPEQKGLKFPESPTFASVVEERLHRKKRLVAAVRAFAQQGFDFWTRPMAVHFSQVKLSNLILAVGCWIRLPRMQPAFSKITLSSGTRRAQWQ